MREADCRKVFRQIVEGVEYCHETVGVAHRDLKADNILIEEGTGMVKVIDFGFSVICNSY